MQRQKAARYKTVQGKATIEVRVNSALQLFDARDPAPFRDRDLDDDFTEYLTSAIEEFSLTTPVLVEIQVASPMTEISPGAIKDSIQTYFEYQIDLKRKQFSKLLKMAQTFLLVGLMILASCLTIAQYLPDFESEILHKTLREGIVIFGWVSLWRPLELLLFDWYPIYDKIRTYKKILQTEIQVTFDSPHQK